MTTVELGYSSNGIVQLMRMSEEKRTLEWLKEALQQAIMLELATLPPYLCGWWSLLQDTESGKAAAKAIGAIIFDEMSHLGHVCNMLTTIGGRPRLAHESVVAPYPCPLPGGIKPKINPNLSVFLSGLTKGSVQMFSEIEAPEKPLATLTEKETFLSIGLFYTAILDAFREHQSKITGKRQLEWNMKNHGEGNSLFAIKAFTDVEHAIEIIKEQGEGTDKTPENEFPGYAGELSHYYVFREIYRGKKLIKVQEKPPVWDFQGAAIPMPNARPMGVVPAGGWAKDPNTVPDATVKAELDKFNMAFSEMLRSLELVWQQDDQGEASKYMVAAIYTHMRALKEPAINLMGMPLPKDRKKSYGPEFRYVPSK